MKRKRGPRPCNKCGGIVKTEYGTTAPDPLHPNDRHYDETPYKRFCLDCGYVHKDGIMYKNLLAGKF